MPKTMIEIRQLADNNGGTSIAPITIPEAVIFSDGDSLSDKINIINTKPDIYHVAWTASSSSALSTRLSDILTLSKGLYLFLLAGPGGVVSCSVSINGSDSVAKRYITRPYEVTPFIYDITEDGTSVYIVSTTSGSQTFSYLERGGLTAIKLK